MAWEYGQQIWDRLMVDVGNELGVAGLMGNLVSESNMIPYRVQGDFTNGYSSSLEYTFRVDSGLISEYEFVNNGPNGGGYGLAQWTFYTRKQALYDLKQVMGVSIGDINLALEYLIQELYNSFPTVLATIKTADSIRVASDVVLHDFESPADQSVAVEEYRLTLGNSVYEEYVGSIPTPTKPKKKKSKVYLYTTKKRRIIYL